MCTVRGFIPHDVSQAIHVTRDRMLRIDFCDRMCICQHNDDHFEVHVDYSNLQKASKMHTTGHYLPGDILPLPGHAPQRDRHPSDMILKK